MGTETDGTHRFPLRTGLMNEENIPLVTAVIPVYNHEKYVVESIRSILNQTYRNIELIVINDGSKDRSHEMVLTLVEECRQRFVRFEYINRENRGLSATLNQALAWAQGKYFSGLASDDVAFPEKIALLVNALEKKDPAYAAAFGNALFIDGEGRQIRLDENGCSSEGETRAVYDNFIQFFLKKRHLDYRGDEFGSYKTIIEGNYLPAMSNVVRASAIIDAGGWTAGNILEDFEMWLKLSKKYKFVYVDQPVAFYRWHELSITQATAGGLLYESMLLIEKEREYCGMNNFAEMWLEIYGSMAYDIAHDQTLPLGKRLSVLKNSHKRSLLLFASKRLARRLALPSR
jgi:alpha-1,3-rhamnosyltransferase